MQSSSRSSLTATRTTSSAGYRSRSLSGGLSCTPPSPSSALMRVKPSLLVSLKKEEKALDKSFADCKEMILQLADFDIDHAEAHNEKLRAERDKYTNVKSAISAAITVIEAKIAQYETKQLVATRPAHRDDTESTDKPVNVGNFKQVLKPDKLSSTASPSILEDWQRQFKAYFAASRANTAPVNVQQEIFPTFLDAILCKRIKRKLLFDTTVTNDADGEEASALESSSTNSRQFIPASCANCSSSACCRQRGRSGPTSSTHGRMHSRTPTSRASTTSHSPSYSSYPQLRT